MSARILKINKLCLNCIPLCILTFFYIVCLMTSCSDSSLITNKLEKKIPKVVDQGNSPSIQIAVVSQDQIIWSQAFGENSSVEQVYMNASVQKVFTATAVLQLVERGLIDLNTDVSEYVPFKVRHPAYLGTPVTVRMLLAHRSGLDSFPHQFSWDTESTFSPQYRPPCPDHLLAMSHEEFLMASLNPEGTNYDERAWRFQPGKKYLYSVSAYPLLRYMIGQITGQSYAEYMHENILAPLGMTSSGFSAKEFAGYHAIPCTRINGENIELPIWNGNGSMMHTTAQDMAKVQIALVNYGRYGSFQLLQPETIKLMQKRTTRFKVLFKSSDDLPCKGHGLGLFAFRSGWFGYGGSAPGFQCLLRFNPSKQVGYVILSNVNAILGGGKNYESARRDIYEVQDALISILDPTFMIRSRAMEIGIIGILVLYLGFFGFWIHRKKSQH